MKAGSADYIDIDASTGALTIKKAGTATVVVTAAETSTYAQATKEVTVTIRKAANPAKIVADTATVMRGGNSVDLSNNVKLNGATGTVGYAIRGEACGCTLNGSVLTSGENTGSVTVNVTVAEEANYNALVATSITVTISEKNTQTISAEAVTATYGDTDKSVSASVTEPATGGGAVSYAVKAGSSKDYIDVNASTGELTIKKAGTATVVVTAAETANYAAATKEVVVTINRANATVTAAAQTVTQNGNISTDITNAILTGALEGHVLADITLKADSTETATTSGMIFPSNAKIVDADGMDVTGNYDIKYIPGTLTVIGAISATVTVTFKVVNGSWDDETTADKTVTLIGLEGALKLAAYQIPAVGSKPADTYGEGSWDVTPNTSTEITQATTYTYTYYYKYPAKEAISETVTFKVVNGSWDDETTTDKTVTLTGLEGDTLKLAADQIPAVGSKPAENYQAGSWDTTPSTNTEITGATTYTYTYAAKEDPETAPDPVIPPTYQITYVLNGGTNNSQNPSSYTVGTGVAGFRDASKEGYTFEGWFADEDFDNEITSISTTQTGDVTLYAKFVEIPKEVYKITYVLDGGSNSSKNPDSYTVGTGVRSLEDASKEGYDFDGWYSDAGFTDEVTGISRKQTGDVTLYAKFTKKAKEDDSGEGEANGPYNITYVLNGGTNSKDNPDSYEYGVGVSKFDRADKRGHKFAGWYLDEDFTKRIKKVKKKQRGDLTLYAKFILADYPIYYRVFYYNDKTHSSVDSRLITPSPKLDQYTFTKAISKDSIAGVKISSGLKPGYKFEGKWYMGDKKFNKLASISDDQTGRVTFYGRAYLDVSADLSVTEKKIAYKDTFTLEVTKVTPKNGKVTFESSKTGVASVDEDGKVTGKSVGSATINVYVEVPGVGKFNVGTCKVTVIQSYATIRLSKTKIKYSLVSKKEQTITVDVGDAEGKITIANKTKSGRRKSVSIRGKKITFKKGAPKGKYIFRVTVAGKGNYKTTIKKFKVRVK